MISPATRGSSTAPGGGVTSGDRPRCSSCGAIIPVYYFESGGAVYCARCKRLAENGQQGLAEGDRLLAALLALSAAFMSAFLVRRLELRYVCIVALGACLLVYRRMRRDQVRAGRNRREALVLASISVGAGAANVLMSGAASAIVALIAVIAARFAWRLTDVGGGVELPDAVPAFSGPHRVEEASTGQA